MASQSRSTQRRGTAERKAARHGAGSRAEKEIFVPGAQEAACNTGSAMLPAVVPEHARTETPGTALVLSHQTLPVPAPGRPAGENAPKGKPRSTRRMVAFGSAFAAALVLAVVGISTERPAESPAQLAQTSVKTDVAQAIAAAPLKQKVDDGGNSVQAKKPSPPHAKAPTKAGSHAVPTLAEKQATPITGKNQPQLAKASTKTDPKLSAETALQQDASLLASKIPIVQNRYAQCLELPNFLRREQCKWQACSGKWGQDGCPSYTREGGDVS